MQSNISLIKERKSNWGIWFQNLQIYPICLQVIRKKNVLTLNKL